MTDHKPLNIVYQISEYTTHAEMSDKGNPNIYYSRLKALYLVCPKCDKGFGANIYKDGLREQLLERAGRFCRVLIRCPDCYYHSVSFPQNDLKWSVEESPPDTVVKKKRREHLITINDHYVWE